MTEGTLQNGPALGRRRKHNKSYPQHLHKKAGWYYFVVQVKDKRKWMPLKTKDEGMALKRWAELETYHRGLQETFSVDSAVTTTKTITFRELAGRFLSEVALQKADKTQETYKRMTEELNKVFGDKRLADITRQEIIRYHDILRDKPYEANRRIALIRLLFQKALDWGYISVNVVDSIKKYKERRYKLKLTEKILFDKIYPAAHPMLKRAIMLAFHMVQHENEVKKLQWTNFDLLKKTVSFTRQKTDEPILIDYSENTAFDAFITSIKAARRDFSPYLIFRAGKQGWLPYNHFRSMWIKALESSGYEKGEFKFKEIRHLANTLMKKANITADKRMAMTGHKTIQANEVYTHPTGGDTVDAGRALSQYGPKEL